MTWVAEVGAFLCVFSHQYPCVGYRDVSFHTLENLHYVVAALFVCPGHVLEDHSAGGGHGGGEGDHWVVVDIVGESEDLLGQSVHQSEANSC